jgi:hypothetical protein
MSPEDRKAFTGIVVGLAWGALTMAGPLAFPSAASWVWQASFGLSAIIVVAGLLVLLYDFFIAPHHRGRRLDPFLAIAAVSIVVAAVSLGIVIARNPLPAVAEPGKSVAPELALSPPATRHEIIWDPKRNYMIFSGPEGAVTNAIGNNVSSTPIFSLKTTNDSYVQDATATWQTEISGIQKLVKASKNLSGYDVKIDGGAITIVGGPDNLIPFTYREQDIVSSQDVAIPFITSAGAKAFIPSNIYIPAMLYALALMPETPGARLDPFTFSVSVAWNLPAPGRQSFLVRATIVNAKPPGATEPKLDALMSFEITKTK